MRPPIHKLICKRLADQSSHHSQHLYHQYIVRNLPAVLQMWRIPTDVPQVAVPIGLKLAEVTADTPLDEVFKHWKESGGVILKNILTPAEAHQITTELESRIDSVQRGSRVPHEDLAAFHGAKPSAPATSSTTARRSESASSRTTSSTPSASAASAKTGTTATTGSRRRPRSTRPARSPRRSCTAT